MDYLFAFIASGLIGLIAQCFLVNTKQGFVNVLVGVICAGVILTFAGAMGAFVGWGGGGVIVSIMDAGEAIYNGMSFLLNNGSMAMLWGFLIMVSGVIITGIVFGLIKPVKKVPKAESKPEEK